MSSTNGMDCWSARLHELEKAHLEANAENAALKQHLAQATAELTHARTHDPACALCFTAEHENLSPLILDIGASKLAILARCVDPAVQELLRLAFHVKGLEQVLDAARVGTCYWSPQTGEVVANYQWHGMLGYQAHEFDVSQKAFMEMLHPDELGDVTRKIGEHMAGATPVFVAEHRMAHKDGHWIWVLNAGKVMERDQEGNPSRAAAIHQDISLCKQLEAELTKALDGAQSAARAKGMFLANMSHEIRTPMAGILGAGTLLRETTLMPEQEELARIMVESTKLLLSIVNNILDLSKIEEGFLKIENVAMDLDDVLASVCTTFGLGACEKGVDLLVKKHDHPHRWIVCDPTRLRQVIFNLVSNALKFTNKGKVVVAADLQPITEEGPRLCKVPDLTPADSSAAVEDRQTANGANTGTTSAAGTDPGRLRLDGLAARGHGSAVAGGPSTSAMTSAAAPNAAPPWQLCVTVEDTGIGMSRDMIAHVFDRFQQGDESITRLYGGSGLGTTISKKLAGLMGGDVLVASEEGKGSTFTVVLPVHVVPPPAESERGDDERELSRNYELTAILAEDNTVNRRILEKTLSSLGVKSIPACNGQVVLDRVADTPHHDIIFMDIQMPVCDGITAAKRLRSSGYGRPIVALTANVLDCDRQTYIDAGMDGVLPKPFNKHLICTEINRLIKIGYLKAEHKENVSGMVPPARLPPKFPVGPPNVSAMRLPSSVAPAVPPDPVTPTVFTATDPRMSSSAQPPGKPSSPSGYFKKRARLDDAYSC